MFNVTLTCNRVCWRLGVHIVRNGGNGFAPYSKTLMPMLVPTKYPWGPVRVAGPEGLRDHLLPASEDESPWLHHCPHGTCQEVSQGLRSVSWGSYLPSSGNRAEEAWPYSHPGHTAAFLLMETRVAELNGKLVHTQLWAEIHNTWPGQTSEAGDTKAAELCPEFKVFTGGPDSFAFY